MGFNFLLITEIKKRKPDLCYFDLNYKGKYPKLEITEEELGEYYPAASNDAKENPPKNHLALGDGKIDLRERLEMARECNARCVLETKTIEALKKSVEWINHVVSAQK